MGKPSRLAGKGAILAVAASLTIGVFTFSTMTSAPQARAADTVAVHNDFESTYDPWVNTRGPVVLDLTDSDSHSGSSSMSVTGRTQNWNGPSITDQVLTPGQTYTFSAWVKLTPESQGPSDVKFTVQHNDTSGDPQPKYDSVPLLSAGVPVNTTAWIQIGGTYTYPTDSSNSVIYIEASTVNGTQPSFFVDDVLITASVPAETEVWDIDFTDGTTGEWIKDGDPTLTVIDSPFSLDDGKILEVSNRVHTWDGIQAPLGKLVPGTTYTFSLRARLAENSNPLDLRFVAMPGYIWVDGTNTVLSTDGWTTISGTYQVPADTDPTLTGLYVGTGDDSSPVTTYYLDDVLVTTAGGGAVPDLTLKPIKDTVDFPVGVAIAGAQTQAPQSDLLTLHYDQVTPNNAMKPVSWYDPSDATHTLRMDPDAKAIMDFANANDIRVYGHNLVWHTQIPAWFFTHDDGTPLTSSAEDQAILTQRLHDHIFGVAKALSDQYGPFGSVGNPLVAFDVVNEAMADGTSGGFRESPWYTTLGPDYITLAFQYADEAFNHTYADSSATRPIALFINDFNTENYPTKVTALHDLIAQLLAQGVPVDGVGHQFHVNLSKSVSTLQDALNAFVDLPIKQAVTEFDVALGSPTIAPTPNEIAKEGYYYMDAFNMFRDFNTAHQGKLFSVTMWGLADNLDSGWLMNQAPLPFDANLQAKSAYYGIINDTADMTEVLESANVFRGEVAPGPDSPSSSEWDKLPVIPLDDQGSGFEARWEPTHMDVYVTVSDTESASSDAVTFQVGTSTYVVHRTPQSGDLTDSFVREYPGGYAMTVRVPLDNVKQGDSIPFDILVAGASAGSLEWNTGDTLGTLALIEPLSFVAIPATPTAPTIDGVGNDPQWANAVTIATDKPDSRNTTTDGATAQVKLLWMDTYLYVLMDVSDPVIDSSNTTDAYQRDSVEIYIDLGNAKNDAYRTGLDYQVRIGADNGISAGSTGSDIRVDSKVTQNPGVGYTVEAVFNLIGYSGAGMFEGLDFQVNDATAGVRTSVYNWADQTQQGYQHTSHWGVGLLLPPVTTPPTPSSPAAPGAEAPTGGVAVTTSAGTGVLLGTLLLAVGGGILARRFRTI